MTTAADSREALAREVVAQGFSIARLGDVATEAAADPWGFAERLWGVPPKMVESQPIRAVPHGRSFASTSGETPLHTDSQSHLDAPPDLQVMVCRRPASQGGETTLVDAWALFDRLEHEDPELLRDLFEVPRRIPFVFGDVFGPTVTERDGRLVFTCSPMRIPEEPIARRLAQRLDVAPVILVKPRAGEVLVVDNHRMLHGRRAFTDPDREFVRLLVWLPEPLGAPARHLERARRSAAALRERAGAVRPPLLRALGLAPDPEAESARARIVLAMLRGVPPGVLARRSGIAEPDLYRLRNAALRAITRALDDPELEGAVDVAELEALLARLRG
jgi:gamma-butyrobetaine dioxygenase